MSLLALFTQGPFLFNLQFKNLVSKRLIRLEVFLKGHGST